MGGYVRDYALQGKPPVLPNIIKAFFNYKPIIHIEVYYSV